jgi:hypothetical protein
MVTPGCRDLANVPAAVVRQKTRSPTGIISIATSASWVSSTVQGGRTP